MNPPGGDPGVPNERTALAWQRTALSLIATSAVIARLTWTRLGLVALLALTAATLLSLWVFAESRGRYARDAGIGSGGRSRGGRAPAAVAVAVALIAVTELAALAPATD